MDVDVINVAEDVVSGGGGGTELGDEEVSQGVVLEIISGGGAGV